MVQNPKKFPKFSLLEEHERLRTAALRSLIQELRTFDEVTSQVSFSEVFNLAQTVLEAEDADLADIFKVSRPTIGRWARGVSTPHPIIQRPICETLVGIAKTKLKHHLP